MGGRAPKTKKKKKGKKERGKGRGEKKTAWTGSTSYVFIPGGPE